jgi:hypothetical protein
VFGRAVDATHSFVAIVCIALLGCGAPAAPPDVGRTSPPSSPVEVAVAPDGVPSRDVASTQVVAPAIRATPLAAPDLSRGVCTGGACWVSPLPTGQAIRAISGSASLVVAVGDAGAILTWDGTELRTEASPEQVDLLDVYAEEPGREYAVGANGAVFSRMVTEAEGARWIARDCATTRTLRAVHGAPLGPVIAAGDGGTLLDLTHDCAPVATQVQTAFIDVHVTGSTWFAVSADRVITFEDRRPVATWMAPDRDLRSIAANDATHVVAVGDHGWLARSGAAWTWIDRTGDTAQVWAVGAPDARRIVSAAGCEIRGDDCADADMPRPHAGVSINALWQGASGAWWIARGGQLSVEPAPSPASRSASVRDTASVPAGCEGAGGAWRIRDGDIVEIDERGARPVVIEPAVDLDVVGIACTEDAAWAAARDGTILRCLPDAAAPTCHALPRRAAGALLTIATVCGEVWIFGDAGDGAYAARAEDPLLEVQLLGLGNHRIESVESDDEVGAWIVVTDGLLRFDPGPPPARRWIPRDDERVTIVRARPHAARIVGAAIDASGTHAVTIGADGTAAVHDLQTGDVLAARYGFERSARARAHFLDDGTFELDIEAVTRTWSLADGTHRSIGLGPIREIPGNRAVRHFARGIELCLRATSERWPHHCDVLEPPAPGRVLGRVLETSRDGTFIVGLSDDGLLHVLDRSTDTSLSVRLARILPVEAQIALALPRWAAVVAGGERLAIVDLHDGSARTIETGLPGATWPGLAIDGAGERVMIDVGPARATFNLANGARVPDVELPRAIVVEGDAIFRAQGHERIVRSDPQSLDVDVRDLDHDGVVLGATGLVAHVGPEGGTPLTEASRADAMTCVDASLRSTECREEEPYVEALGVCPRDGPFCVLRRAEDESLVAVRRDAPERRIPIAGSEGARWMDYEGVPALSFSRDGRILALSSADPDDPRADPHVSVAELATGREILSRREGWPDALSPDGHWLVMTYVSSPSIGPTVLVELGTERRRELTGDVDAQRLVFAADSSALATPSTIISIPALDAVPIDPPLDARIAAMWWIGDDAVVFATDPLDGLHVFGRDGRARGVVPIPTSGEDEDDPHATLEALRDRPFLATCADRELVVYDVARGAVHARHANRCPYGGFDWSDAVINAVAQPPVVSWDGSLLIERESQRRAIVTRLTDGAWVAFELVSVDGQTHVVAVAEDGAMAAAPSVLGAVGIRTCGTSLERSPVRGAELRRRFHRPTLVADLFAGRPLPHATEFGACPPR